MNENKIAEFKSGGKVILSHLFILSSNVVIADIIQTHLQVSECFSRNIYV